MSKGVARYNPSAKQSGSDALTYFTIDNGLPGNTVLSIAEDQERNLWFGFSGGLFRFNGTSFVNITQGGPWE